MIVNRRPLYIDYYHYHNKAMKMRHVMKSLFAQFLEGHAGAPRSTEYVQSTSARPVEFANKQLGSNFTLFFFFFFSFFFYVHNFVSLNLNERPIKRPIESPNQSVLLFLNTPYSGLPYSGNWPAMCEE
jgi:hypothetical protein